MTAPVPALEVGLSQLDLLEAEAVHVLREVAAEFERPALLFSGGKDSIVMLKPAEKAFWPGRIPFPLVHVHTRGARSTDMTGWTRTPWVGWCVDSCRPGTRCRRQPATAWPTAA